MDEVKTMTVAEIGVMREIVRWRRTQGYRCEVVSSRVLGHWVEWEEAYNRRSVTVDRSVPEQFAVREVGRFAYNQWYAAKNFTEAVDMLVALGYLPARFSTAYRAGWDAGCDSERVRVDWSEYPAVSA